MSEFTFCSVFSIDEALMKLAQEPGACVVAGGTDVTLRIREGRQRPGLLLDISRIAELQGIREERGYIHIGATTTLAAIASSELLAAKAPALYEAANRFADPNTRNRATIGGNIVNASPGADTPPPLCALGAEVLLRSPKGTRCLPVWEYLLGPNRTALLPGELVLGVRFKPCPHSAFIKIGLRKAMAISVETAAVALEKDENGVITACGIAFGALGPKALRAWNTEKALLNKRPSNAVLAAAVAAVGTDIQPRDGLRGTKEYRYSTAGVIFERAFLAAYHSSI
ncbi:MAG: xanthine dehydrogenase family protein subunit M [Christensenellaceae bacterium]|jgi:CO/xanthine dehydrogenase FAD-binding subunit|nr:xanthine dehydrogenase family protein subunit M [Christensenellaceae bacterium]